MQTNNTALNMQTHLKIICLTLNSKLTYNKYIDNTTAMATKIIPVLTKWDKHKVTLRSTYKPQQNQYCDMSRPWSHVAATPIITEFKNEQCYALKLGANDIQHLHDQTMILQFNTHTWNITNQTNITTSYPYNIQTKGANYIQQLHIHYL